MFLYTVIEAMAGIVAFILLVVCTRKNDGVVYNKLDKLGRITNILLIPIYVFVLPFCLLLGMISYPAYNGFLGIIGWIVAIINASATLFCGLGLGFSIALRKKGKSKLGFAVQFVGFAGGALSIVLFLLFYGNLLKSLN
jgi:hypothetical protein